MKKVLYGLVLLLLIGIMSAGCEVQKTGESYLSPSPSDYLSPSPSESIPDPKDVDVTPVPTPECNPNAPDSAIECHDKCNGNWLEKGYCASDGTCKTSKWRKGAERCSKRGKYWTCKDAKCVVIHWGCKKHEDCAGYRPHCIQGDYLYTAECVYDLPTNYCVGKLKEKCFEDKDGNPIPCGYCKEGEQYPGIHFPDRCDVHEPCASPTPSSS